MRIEQGRCLRPDGKEREAGRGCHPKGAQGTEGFDAGEWQVCEEEGVREINQ